MASTTNDGVDWVADIVREIPFELNLSVKLACIHGEQAKGSVLAALEAGRVRSLPPIAELRPGTIEACQRIVEVMGHEPFLDALEQGADSVLASRSSDAAMVTALALGSGLPAGVSLHAAKTLDSRWTIHASCSA